MKSRKICGARAFSLVETAVVLAILSAVGLLTINVGVGSLSRYFFRAELDILTSSLLSARSEAVSAMFGESHGVHFESDKFVVFVGDVYDPADPRNGVFPLFPGLLLNSTGDVVFEKLSGDAVSPQTVELKNGQLTASLVINRAGGIDW